MQAEKRDAPASNTLYVTDLDGTLLRGDQRVAPQAQAALNGLIAQGMALTYATARSFTSASRVTDGLRFVLPVITYNGSMLVDPASGRVLEACVLPPEACVALREVCLSNQLFPLVYAFVEGTERVSWLCGHEGPGIANYLRTRHGDPRLRPTQAGDALFAGQPFYLTFIGTQDDMREARRLLAGIPGMHSNLQEATYTPGEFWMEMYREDATKAHAARRVQRMVGAARLVCFGDNLNDLPMFQEADAAYAVANAVPALKAKATGIIASNEENGVPGFLQETWERA